MDEALGLFGIAPLLPEAVIDDVAAAPSASLFSDELSNVFVSVSVPLEPTLEDVPLLPDFCMENQKSNACLNNNRR